MLKQKSMGKSKIIMERIKKINNNMKEKEDECDDNNNYD